MDHITDKSGNRLDALSDAAGPQDVYEISVNSCRRLVSCNSIWYFEGMVNSIKPMWALLLGSHYGFILGFVWDTKTCLPQVTSQDVIGVRCEIWRDSLLKPMESEQQDPLKDRKNLLGTTNLSLYEIRDEGSTATSKYSF
jgi:hypothetical protein